MNRGDAVALRPSPSSGDLRDARLGLWRGFKERFEMHDVLEVVLELTLQGESVSSRQWAAVYVCIQCPKMSTDIDRLMPPIASLDFVKAAAYRAIALAETKNRNIFELVLFQCIATNRHRKYARKYERVRLS